MYAREGGYCLLCQRLPIDDFHEITQRSHTAKSKQVEQGIFDEDNVVGLCRSCHQIYGNTKFGEILFRVLLHERYGIGERPNLSNG